MGNFKQNEFNQENPIASSDEVLGSMPARDRKDVKRILKESRKTNEFIDFKRKGQEIRNSDEKAGFLTRLVKKHGSKIAGTMAAGMLFAGFIWQGEKRVENAEKTNAIYLKQNPVTPSEDYFGDVVSEQEKQEQASEDAAFNKAKDDFEKAEAERARKYIEDMNKAVQHPEDLNNIH